MITKLFQMMKITPGKMNYQIQKMIKIKMTSTMVKRIMAMKPITKHSLIIKLKKSITIMKSNQVSIKRNKNNE